MKRKIIKPFLQNLDIPVPIAHRGASKELPGNTLEAFIRARKISPGCMLELDVWPTKDGQIMVYHDDRLDYTTNGSGPLPRYTWKEIRQLDAGFLFSPDNQNYPMRGKGYKIPELTTVLKRFPHALISIDIKYNSIHFADAVLQKLMLLKALDRVVIGSFHTLVIHWVRSRFPLVATSAGKWDIILYLARTMSPIPWLVPSGGDILMIPEFSHDEQPEYLGDNAKQGFRVLTKELLHRAKNDGKPVMPWTINKKSNMERLLDMGVDGIISDDIALLDRVIHNR